MPNRAQPLEILLVEDNPGDVLLTQTALADAKMINNIHVAGDGVEALAFLRREGKFTDAPRPDLILTDLNMPRMDGHEMVEIIKQDSSLRTIPIVILTSSEAERDIAKTYNLGANCFISKPVDLEQFIIVIKTIENFWLSLVKLPQNSH